MTTMTPSLFAFLFVFLTLRYAIGIQVTPNSPCSSVCIDSNDLDYSDPNSSNTKGSDISCQDSDFSSSGPGMKWQKCLSCLQNSTFSQGSENDQMWFLYNLRYSFDYCIFGFPNATNIGSSPCITSTACGRLETALKDGDLETRNLQAYAYCDADGASMTGSAYETCLACVSASGDDRYIGNALTALEAGCLQRPATGVILGLNDTIFAHTAIGIIDPGTVPKEESKKKSPVSTGLIAGIVAGVLILIAALAAFLYIRYRKRKNKDLRSNPRWGRHRPKSSLSFKCQKVLSPTSPKFFLDADDTSIDNMTETTGPVRRHIESKSRNINRTPPTATSSFQSLSVIAQNQTANSFNNTEKKTSIQINTGPLPLRSITTNITTLPPTAHHSPNATRPSPASAATTDTYFTTPTSTTQLIPPGFSPYVPADHGIASPRAGADTMRSPSLGTVTSPGQPAQTSPMLNQHGWPLPLREADISFPPPPTPKNGRVDRKKSFQTFKKGKRESGSPVESKNIQLSFPGPPMKK